MCVNIEKENLSLASVYDRGLRGGTFLVNHPSVSSDSGIHKVEKIPQHFHVERIQAVWPHF